MIKAFPKIFQLGQKYITDIFDGEVEITEKVDGSQFVFGKIDNKLYMRSKGKEIYEESVDKMFQKAVNYVKIIEHLIPDNTVLYCEYLQNPRHNILTYSRVPKNNLILFGVSKKGEEFSRYYEDIAYKLSIECVPVLFEGVIDSANEVIKLLEKDSVLGNTHIEGFVVKNYSKSFMLGDIPIPIMAGKFVSEKFKEVHKKEWKKEYTSHGKYQLFLDGFRTEARWRKAVQHLREDGILDVSPRDIGKLIKEVNRDISEENIEEIKTFLWNHFGKDLLRRSTAGLPEWYKEQLLKGGMNEES